MRTLVLESIIRTKQAISHNGGEKNGNMGLFRTEQKWYQNENGQFKPFHCPVVSANSLRSNLRKISSQIFLDELGEEDQPLKVKAEMFNMLFSGGGQVTSTKKDIAGDIGHFKDIRKNITPLSLFGTSKGNAMLPGKVDVYDMIPIGKETMWLLPDTLKKAAFSENRSVSEYLKLRFNTTKDLKNEKAFEKYLEAIEDNKERQSIQMLYYTQVLTAGVPMYWKIVLRDVTDVEYSLFMNALTRFQQIGRAGGKRSNGMGEFEFVEMQWEDITKIGKNLTIENKSTHNLYIDFLKSRKDETKDFLKDLV